MGWADRLREEDCILRHQVLDLVLHLNCDFSEHVKGLRRHVWQLLKLGGVLNQGLEVSWVFKMLHCHAKAFLAHVSPFEDHVSGLINRVLVLLAKLLRGKALLEHVLFAWDDNLLVNVLDKGLHEGRADFLDPLLEPDIVVKELALARQNAEVDREVVVIAIDNLDQTVLDVLSDVQHSGQVDHTLFVPTALTDSPDHEVLVEIPQFLEENDRLLVVQEEGHQLREYVVQDEVARLHSGLADRKEEILRHLGCWPIEQCLHFMVEAAIRQLAEDFNDFRRAPNIEEGCRNILCERYFRHHSDLSGILCEVESAVTLPDKGVDRVFEDAELQGWTFPLTIKQQGDRDLKVLRLALVKDVDEGVELMWLEVDIGGHLLVKFSKTFEDFKPVQIAKVLAESPSEVGGVCVPLQRRLVYLLFLEWVARLVRLKYVEGDSRVGRLLPLVVEGQVQYRVRHRSLVDVFEVLQHHVEHLVVEVAVVPKVTEDLPWLHDVAYVAEAVKV